MAEPFETLREVGVALTGVKDQINTYAKIGAFVVAILVAVTGFFYNKLDRVEDGIVRVETKLDGIEAHLSRIATNTSEIKDAVTMASIAPMPQEGAFEGYVGVKVNASEFSKFPGVESIRARLGEPAWMYVPVAQ